MTSQAVYAAANLQRLRLDGNEITELDATALRSLTSLVSLNLSRNRICKLPASLGSLKKLRKLLVNGCVPPSVCALHSDTFTHWKLAHLRTCTLVHFQSCTRLYIFNLAHMRTFSCTYT
jgi:hypothetical protein